MPRFYVNLDHVATLRQARGTSYPDVVEASLLAARSGAVHGITLHLREDRRHVNDDDVRRVKDAVALPFNFELGAAEDVVLRCLEVEPAQATLVPERREELTTEGGLDLARTGPRVRDVTARLAEQGIVVSLFVDPDPETIRACPGTGATHVELHTGRYADAQDASTAAAELEKLRSAAELARELGLVVNAGHGLTVDNVAPVAAIPGLNDLNIGHAVVSRAVLVGLETACREMWAAIRAGAEGSPPSTREHRSG